jgi:outer membrane protein TolC
MKVWTILALAICLPAAAQTPAEKTLLTLQEAVTIALDRYPDVAKARSAADALKGIIREVRSQAFPQVTFEANGARSRDPSFLNASAFDNFPEELRNAMTPEASNLFNYSVKVSQPLYTAGKIGTALKLASVQSEGAAADIDRTLQDLAREVVKSCYGLMWAERHRSLVAETQEQRKLHVEMARTRLKNGVATEVDVLRSEVAVANGAPELVRADNAIRQTRAQLNFYLVRPLDYPTQIVGDFKEQAWDQWNLDTLAQEAFLRRPDLERLRIAERSAAVQLDLARAENRLRLDTNASYGISARKPQNFFNTLYASWRFSVSLTLPIFDGYKRSGMIYQATANQRIARLEREKTEQQVRLELQQGTDELKAATETIAAARANTEQADKVLQMTQENYKFGAATTLDIVDAQTALSLARNNLLFGLYAYSVARANLLWTAGRSPWE